MANNCKYQKYQRFVSYDSGTTWQPLQEFHRGELIEEYSPACGAELKYRWVTMPSGTSFICYGYDKYTKEKKQQSYDNINWTDVEPAEYRKGSLIERNSDDCGYVPPTPVNVKWVAKFSGGTASAECGSSSSQEIMRGEIASDVEMVAIGDCVTSIGDNAFENCYSLTSITIPDSIETIGLAAFGRCSGLTDVTIPSSITNIGRYAFYSCSGLTSLTIETATPPTLQNYAFDNTNCPIYVPAASINTYKATSGWSAYESRIQAIP